MNNRTIWKMHFVGRGVAHWLLHSSGCSILFSPSPLYSSPPPKAPSKLELEYSGNFKAHHIGLARFPPLFSWAVKFCTNSSTSVMQGPVLFCQGKRRGRRFYKVCNLSFEGAITPRSAPSGRKMWKQWSWNTLETQKVSYSKCNLSVLDKRARSGVSVIAEQLTFILAKTTVLFWQAVLVQEKSSYVHVF